MPQATQPVSAESPVWTRCPIFFFPSPRSPSISGITASANKFVLGVSTSFSQRLWERLSNQLEVISQYVSLVLQIFVIRVKRFCVNVRGHRVPCGGSLPCVLCLANPGVPVTWVCVGIWDPRQRSWTGRLKVPSSVLHTRVQYSRQGCWF